LIKRFLTANQPATFAVAKSLYDAIPPRPSSKKTNDDLFADDIFDDPFGEDDLAGTSSTDTSIVDESGRKLLIFSDNRQEAAFCGLLRKKVQPDHVEKGHSPVPSGGSESKTCDH
jgi:hypothetical protein